MHKPNLTEGIEGGIRVKAWGEWLPAHVNARAPLAGVPYSRGSRGRPPGGLPVAIATPRAWQGRRAPRGFATTGSDVFHLPSEGGVGPGCEVPPQPAGRERAGSRVTETPGESRLPAFVAHSWAATMALLLRFVLLCGVAGEWGTDQ